ncbi:hypothetical protein BKA24_000941 [Microbacterium marinum]|uniref:Uncharacterized protein n=1 Tax=Microbacterium marinum TaxID=421115 RepID=A0A7W7FHN4_9MICO|nr:hypothetical protein [Microbacterium marinum]MBB4666232.1 hypothetical protein [Microbacterium marinum]
MSTRTVQLVGSDEEIIAVARAAPEAIAADRGLSNRLLPAVMRLSRERRDFVSGPRDAIPVPRRSDLGTGSHDRVWGTVLTFALLAVVTAASMFLPPVRGVVVDIEIALPLVIVATPIAAVLLVVVGLLARRASPYPAYVGMVMTVIVAVVLALLIGYRMIVGTASRGVPFTQEQLGLWFVAGGILLVELVALAVIFARRRGSATSPARGADARADRSRDDQALRKEAVRLAAFRPDAADAAALSSRWNAALSAADVSDETRAQGRRLGPVPWLVWAHFDGEIDVADRR